MSPGPPLYTFEKGRAWRAYEVWREVEFVQLGGGEEKAGHQVGHQDLFAEFVLGGSPLAASHLHRPLVGVRYDAHGLRDGLVQHWMLGKEKREKLWGGVSKEENAMQQHVVIFLNINLPHILGPSTSNYLPNLEVPTVYNHRGVHANPLGRVYELPIRESVDIRSSPPKHRVSPAASFQTAE